jgi:hypothetical protein
MTSSMNIALIKHGMLGDFPSKMVDYHKGEARWRSKVLGELMGFNGFSQHHWGP